MNAGGNPVSGKARGQCGEAESEDTVGPSREREGKPGGERAGGTVGMQPSAKAEGKPAGEGEGARVGKRCLENCPDARCGACGGPVAPSARWGCRKVGRLCLNRLVAALRAAPSRLRLGHGGREGTARSRGLRPLRSRLRTRRGAPRFSWMLMSRSVMGAESLLRGLIRRGPVWAVGARRARDAGV
jgi:hypothetical protein